MNANDQVPTTLRIVENLALPSVQVIVMKANMSCSHCRGRVSRIISKINTGNLVDYVVDVKNEQVIVRSFTDFDKLADQSIKLLDSDYHCKRWKSKKVAFHFSLASNYKESKETFNCLVTSEECSKYRLVQP